MAAQRSTNVFEIKVGGMPLSDDVAGALLEAIVEDEVNLPDTVELAFRDPMRSVLSAGRFEIGGQPEDRRRLRGDVRRHDDLRRRDHRRRGRDRT